MPATSTIAPDVLAVLARAQVLPDRVVLPEQLDYGLYKKVDRVLRTAGGKWNKSARAHVFKTDPREVLQVAVADGEITDRKKQFQVFETPLPIAEHMVFLAGYDCERVLEPSAGSGNIVRAWRMHSRAAVRCIEIRSEACAELRKLCPDIIESDFLTVPAPRPAEFDAVTVNPPFTAGQDARHVLHAWKFVKPGGKLIAIMSPGFKHRTTALYNDVRELHDAHKFHERELPPGTFKDEGTNVRSYLVGWFKP